MPSYGTSQDIEARVRRGVLVDRTADGSAITVDLVLTIRPIESPIPSEDDRLAFGGETFIVTNRREMKDLKARTTHYRIEARDE